MNRHRVWRWALVAIGAWLLTACASLALHEPVRVQVVGLDPMSGEGMEMRMAVKLRIQNPNDTDLEFDGISLSMDVRESTFATGVSSEKGSLPRFGEIVVTVPVSISALSAARQALGIATGGNNRIDYALHGRLAGTKFGSVPFDSTGSIDLPNGLSFN